VNVAPSLLGESSLIGPSSASSSLRLDLELALLLAAPALPFVASFLLLCARGAPAAAPLPRARLRSFLTLPSLLGKSPLAGPSSALGSLRLDLEPALLLAAPALSFVASVVLLYARGAPAAPRACLRSFLPLRRSALPSSSPSPSLLGESSLNLPRPWDAALFRGWK